MKIYSLFFCLVGFTGGVFASFDDLIFDDLSQSVCEPFCCETSKKFEPISTSKVGFYHQAVQALAKKIEINGNNAIDNKNYTALKNVLSEHWEKVIDHHKPEIVEDLLHRKKNIKLFIILFFDLLCSCDKSIEVQCYIRNCISERRHLEHYERLKKAYNYALDVYNFSSKEVYNFNSKSKTQPWVTQLMFDLLIQQCCCS